jgi:hypothetical protein
LVVEEALLTLAFALEDEIGTEGACELLESTIKDMRREAKFIRKRDRKLVQLEEGTQ